MLLQAFNKAMWRAFCERANWNPAAGSRAAMVSAVAEKLKPHLSPKEVDITKLGI
jgi:hypothetical protein